MRLHEGKLHRSLRVKTTRAFLECLHIFVQWVEIHGKSYCKLSPFDEFGALSRGKKIVRHFSLVISLFKVWDYRVIIYRYSSIIYRFTCNKQTLHQQQNDMFTYRNTQLFKNGRHFKFQPHFAWLALLPKTLCFHHYYM